MGNTKRTRRTFGSIRQLRPKSFQARYTGPDGQVHKGRKPFPTRAKAEAFLAKQLTDINNDTWNPFEEDTGSAKAKPPTVEEYFDEWLKKQTITPRTRSDYRTLFDRHLSPTFGPIPVKFVTAAMFDDWYDRTLVDEPTTRAHAYRLLRSVFAEATRNKLIKENPV